MADVCISRLPFIYLTCNDSKCFYISNRWVESKVADRMNAVLVDVRKVAQFLDKLTASKQPNSKSYSNVKNGLDDPLIHVKLKFF